MLTGLGYQLMLVRMFVLLALGAPAGAALPSCTSCESWCTGHCAFAGPAPLGQRQNITLYRMTPWNITDLSNKNTGDPAGDLLFNMFERSKALECRHLAPGSRGYQSKCGGGATPSWLLHENLVYLQWVVEVDGKWGPYQPCNMNITTHSSGQLGDGKWHCEGARFHGNFSDNSSTSCDCPRTAMSVGWENENSSLPEHFSRNRDHNYWVSPICNATTRRLCSDHLQNFTSCMACIENRSNYETLRKLNCSTGLIALGSRSQHQHGICPPPKPACVGCKAEFGRWCGSVRAAHNCTQCVDHIKRNLSLITAACGGTKERALESWYSLVYFGGWCSGPTLPDYDGNATWIGFQPNTRLLTHKLGGSWFSTPSAGLCAPAARPGDGSGCSWRPLQMKKALNYSCLQSNVATAVRAHAPACFARCPDGAESNPSSASDCWLFCFFNALLGNTTLGMAPIAREAMLRAWHRSFDSDIPHQGGCPRATIAPPAAGHQFMKTDDDLSAPSQLDCRWTVNDHRQPGHLFGRLSSSTRSHISDAAVSVYPGHGDGFVAHPADMLAIRPYDAASLTEGREATVVVPVDQAQCTIRNDSDSYEGYYHSLPAAAVSDCCAACDKDNTCTFATWAKEVTGGKCWLKNATTLTPRTSRGTVLLTVDGRPPPPPPPVLYWQDAWERNLATGPAAMAAFVQKGLDGTQSALLMIDYEPPFSVSWNFSTKFSTVPEPLWKNLLASVHAHSFDRNWTNLVSWKAPAGAEKWHDLSPAQQLVMQEVSWNYFCQRYFTVGIKAIKAVLPANVKLSFWNWPYKFWFHQGVIGNARWGPLMDELGWLWAELPIFMPDLYPEFYSGSDGAKPATLAKCMTENRSSTRAYFQDNVNEALRLRDKYNPAAKVYLSVWWHYMCAQEVTANATSPPFVQDGNLEALFATTGHDGLAIWGSVGSFTGEDHDEGQVAAYFESKWGALVAAHCGFTI
jgi:hypothetical protein